MNKSKISRFFGRSFLYLCFLVFALIVMVPVYWMSRSAWSNVQDLYKMPLIYFPAFSPNNFQTLMERLPEVRKVELFGDTLHVSIGDTDSALPAIQAALQDAGLRDAQLRQIPPSLEDVFIAVLHQRSRQVEASGQPNGVSDTNGGRP